MKLFPLLLLTFLISIHSKTAEEWRARSIYEILTDRFARSDDANKTECTDLYKYCGGTYKGLINHLDYIQGMGFNAIWISPFVKNTPGSYHGYHMVSLYEVNEEFGTEQDLIDFIEECHKRDIWIMLDVVANHVGEVKKAADGTEDFSHIKPFNESKYYHDECQITDWTDQWMIENCRLANLPDLKQEDEWVTQQLFDWIHNIVTKYNIDGLRVDTVIEIPKWFWDGFKGYSNVFQIGEVFNGDPVYVNGYMEHLGSLFNYPLSFIIKDAFCGNLRRLEDYLINTRPHYTDPTIMGVFLENHDNPRFLYNCGDKNKLVNAIAYTLTWEGIPVLYYGAEQYFDGGADPLNREPLWETEFVQTDHYKMIGKINKFRTESMFYKEEAVQRYVDNSFYAFTRGPRVLVCLTIQANIEKVITYHEFEEGATLCNVLADDGEEDCVVVTNGEIKVRMGAMPKIYNLKFK